MNQNVDTYRLKKQQDTFLRFLLDGKREITPSEADIRAGILGLDWMKPPFVIAAIAPDYIGVPPKDLDDLLYDYQEAVSQKLDASRYSNICLTNSYCNVIALLSLSGKNQPADQLDELFIAVHKKLSLQFGRDLFISIGSVVDDWSKISTSAADAAEMLAYKFQYASRGVINISNIMRFEHARYVSNNVAIDRVIGCFRDGDLGRMAVRLDELITQVRYRPGVSKTSIRRTMIELVIHVLNIASNAGVDVDEVLAGRDPYRWILDQGRTEIITDWFMDVCTKLIMKINASKQSEEKRTIQMACDYVGENFHRNDLSLQQVSAYVGLSNSYFSQLFKQEMGEGLNAYISQLRLEKAKELLLSTDLTTEEIALQVGFSTVSYFSTVFKNKMHMTPIECRRRATETGAKT